jgi:hypothetical protein
MRLESKPSRTGNKKKKESGSRIYENCFFGDYANILFGQREEIMLEHEIYALKYAGPFVRTGAHLMWYQDWDRIS